MKNYKNKNSIFVTQPNLPDLSRFTEMLQDIWQKKILTNNGEYHQRFEKEISAYLKIPHCNLFNNGTMALLVGLQALRITGEVITTPFSFVATSHCLKWNGIEPVFCDIEDNTFNLNPEKIESLITHKTTAILPVHVYGNPCNVDSIVNIANTYGLKVIYDAAHAFGVTLNGKNIVQYGDISILSFHATKVFNTFEGGAITHQDENLKTRIDYLKNFGFAGETTVIGVGINAKMNELQSAFGILQLQIIEEEIRKRKSIAARYRGNLAEIPGIRTLNDLPGVKHNYSYFPILVDSLIYGVSRDYIYDELKKQNVFTRRYFYPLISHFPPYSNLPSANPAQLPVAERVANQVLCLPIYGALELSVVDMICEFIKSCRR